MCLPATPRGRRREPHPMAGLHRLNPSRPGPRHGPPSRPALWWRRWTVQGVVVALVASLTAVTALASSPNVADAAQTNCTPDAGYSTCTEFTYSGADQTFALPAAADATNVKVKLWGAGGGGDFGPGVDAGGGGGYTEGVLNLTGNSSVT